MENKKLGLEPAFPCEGNRMSQYGEYIGKYIGMSKRFYAACAAMQGLITSGIYNPVLQIEGRDIFNHTIIDQSFELADELFKQENL